VWITVAEGAEGARNSPVEGSVKRAGERTMMQHCSVTLWTSERVDVVCVRVCVVVVAVGGPEGGERTEKVG